MNLRCLNGLLALVPSRLIRQMLQIFLELNFKGLQQSSGKEKESCCLLSRPRQNVKLGSLISRCIRATTAEKCTKKRDARAKLLFCLSKPIAFLPYSLPSSSSLRKLPKYLYPALYLRTNSCEFFVDNYISLQYIQKGNQNKRN